VFFALFVKLFLNTDRNGATPLLLLKKEFEHVAKVEVGTNYIVHYKLQL
jgi:hypothetical protein